MRYNYTTIFNIKKNNNTQTSIVKFIKLFLRLSIKYMEAVTLITEVEIATEYIISHIKLK